MTSEHNNNYYNGALLINYFITILAYISYYLQIFTAKRREIVELR